MRRFRRSWRRAFRTFVLSFAVAAVLAGPASAQVGTQMPPGYAPDVEAELAMVDSHEVTAAVTSEGTDRDDIALGFGLGLILATACAVFVAALRSDRSRAVHA